MYSRYDGGRIRRLLSLPLGRCLIAVRLRESQSCIRHVTRPRHLVVFFTVSTCLPPDNVQRGCQEPKLASQQKTKTAMSWIIVIASRAPTRRTRSRHKQQLKTDAINNRRANGNAELCDINEGTYWGGDGKTPVATACPEGWMVKMTIRIHQICIHIMVFLCLRHLMCFSPSATQEKTGKCD